MSYTEGIFLTNYLEYFTYNAETFTSASQTSTDPVQHQTTVAHMKKVNISLKKNYFIC